MSFRASLPPSIRDGAALAFELARFEIAHGGVKHPAWRDRPK